MPLPAPAHVVVVEDEPVTRSMIAAYLEGAGYLVSAVGDVRSLHDLVARGGVDLVLLDVELPDEDGFSAAAALRARSNAGLIFVTRRTDLTDRVVAFEIGADDYVVKPPEMRELLARVRAVLRRRDDAGHGARPSPPPAGASVLRFGEWVLDEQRHCLVGPSREPIAVTRGERAILAALIEARGHVVRRQTLAAALGVAASRAGARSLDVLVHRLRRKLGEGGTIEPQILLTVHGVGYRLGVDVPAGG